MIKLRKLDKKGVLGLDTAKMFIIAILTLAVVAFALIVAINALNTNSGLTPNSIAANQTTAIFNNVTTGTASFFGNAATWFALLAVVIIILIIAVVIVAVNRFGGRGASGNL